MNHSQKVFQVFFKNSIGTPDLYIGGAFVIAPSIDAALAIAASYGEITSIHGQGDYPLITGMKQPAAQVAVTE